MTATQETNGTTRTRRGFPGLACPHCGNSDEAIQIAAHNLKVECSGCGEEVTMKDVAKVYETWQRFFAWVELAK